MTQFNGKHDKSCHACTKQHDERVKKQNPFPDVPEEAIVKPEQERPEAIDVTPEQVDGKDEAEYEQMKSADYDMDGDDNPDVDPEA
jgi:hypothetical protein